MGSGLRMSTADAVKRGLITEIDAKKIDTAGSGRRLAADPDEHLSPAPRKAAVAPAAKALAAAQRESNEIPQRLVYEALCQRLPGIPVWEQEGLIPGRKFRADIFLPPDITVEVDGLRYHRSKESFQQDRMRANLFVTHGFRVFRAFTKQCLDADMRLDLVDQIIQAYYARRDPAAQACTCGQ